MPAAPSSAAPAHAAARAVSKPALAVVSESVADRVRRLQAESRALAREHVAALLSGLEDAQRLSAEVADGGDAYPIGVRDIARRLADTLRLHRQTMSQLAHKG